MIEVDASGKIIIDEGNDAALTANLTDVNGAVYDATGCSFVFTVKAEMDDAAIVIQKFSPAQGIDITQAAAGIIVINFVGADTGLKSGVYYYDFRMTDALGKVSTVHPVGVFYIRKTLY